MRIGLRLIAALLLAVVVQAAAQEKAAPEAKPEAAEAKPAPEAKPEAPEAATTVSPQVMAQVSRMHSHYARFYKRNSDQLAKNLKLPEATAVQCAYMSGFGGGQMACCVLSSKENGPWESAVLDLNKNKDLTDDPVLKLPEPRKRGDVKFTHNDVEYTFTVSYWQSRGSTGLNIYPKSGKSGLVTLGDKKYQFVAPDCNLSGKIDKGDRVHLIADETGKLLPYNQMIHLQIGQQAKPILIQGKWYVAAPNEKGDGLDVGAYKGEMYTFTIDHSKVVKPENARQTITLYRADNYRCSVQVTDPAKGVKLPADTYRYMAVMIASSPKPLSFSMRSKKVDKDITVSLDKPKLQASVSLRGRKVNVNQKVIAPSGISYNMARGKKGPLVEILSAKDPEKVLVQGNMKYG